MSTESVKALDVLLVDDDAVDREFVIRTLTKAARSRYNITTASNVDEGLKAASQKEFDLILLDYRMPVRDGSELILAIRGEMQNSYTTIVVMSSAEDEDIALECIKSGAQDFVLKSEITASRLHRVILQARARFDLERKLFESYQRVKELAETDALTGLSNRYRFDENLRQLIGSNVRRSDQIALILLDLDNFKYVNDNYGHEIGDQLLKKVVTRLRFTLRGNEVFARLGGDEFAIIIPNLGKPEHASIVPRRILHALQVPFDIEKYSVRTSASIGIAIYPNNTPSPEELFKFADIAMYRAKKLGRNQICFFEEEMQRNFYYRYSMEQQLSSALGNSEFVLNYQPVVNPLTEETIGFEALVRWRHEEELRYPDQFISIAEEANYINEIGLWVFQQAVTDLERWSAICGRNFTMAINLSPRQLEDNELAKKFASIAFQYKIPPERIELELTETVLMKDVEVVNEALRRLVQVGFTIALDDFGTGFSSVSHLQNFPIHTVKMDRSLMPSPTDPNSEKSIALVRGLALMINTLGLSIVCEGIEIEEHVALCRELKINRAQGYHYSRPISSEEIEETILLTA